MKFLPRRGKGRVQPNSSKLGISPQDCNLSERVGSLATVASEMLKTTLVKKGNKKGIRQYRTYLYKEAAVSTLLVTPSDHKASCHQNIRW